MSYFADEYTYCVDENTNCGSVMSYCADVKSYCGSANPYFADETAYCGNIKPGSAERRAKVKAQCAEASFCLELFTF